MGNHAMSKRTRKKIISEILRVLEQGPASSRFIADNIQVGYHSRMKTTIGRIGVLLASLRRENKVKYTYVYTNGGYNFHLWELVKND